jgi:hypothetical protein
MTGSIGIERINPVESKGAGQLGHASSVVAADDERSG